jgi:hypothetical protein
VGAGSRRQSLAPQGFVNAFVANRFSLMTFIAPQNGSYVDINRSSGKDMHPFAQSSRMDVYRMHSLKNGMAKS